MRIAEMDWRMVEDWVRHDDRCVLPLGSTEQHAGLSLATDAILAERVAIEAAEPLGIPVFPVLPYGLTPYFTSFAGSVTLRVATFAALLRDVIDSLKQTGFRRVLIVNGIITGVLILSFAALTPRVPLPFIAALLFVHGLSRSMQFTSVNTLSYVDVPKPQMSGANTLASVLQQLAMGMGVAVGALALRASGWLRGNHTGVPALGDFHIAFALVAIMAFSAVRDCFTLDPHAGAEVTGHRPARVAET